MPLLVQVLYISIVYSLTMLGEKQHYFFHFTGEKNEGIRK